MAFRVGSSTCDAYVNSKKSFLPLFPVSLSYSLYGFFPFPLFFRSAGPTLNTFEIPNAFSAFLCIMEMLSSRLTSRPLLSLPPPSPTPPLPFSQQTTNVFLVHFELKATPLRFELCRRYTVAGTMIELVPPYFVLNWTSAGTQLHQRSAT